MKIQDTLRGIEQCFHDPSLEEHETQCKGCPYFYPDESTAECHKRLLDDTYPLVKKQIPIKVRSSEDHYGNRFSNCPKCGAYLSSTFHNNNCGRCGQAIAW